MKLCDIGRVFEVSRHFSCSLPPALFTCRQRSGVHCFKRQILALMCQELLGDGNVSTSTFGESHSDPPSGFSGSSPSSSPLEDGAAELVATDWQNEPDPDPGQIQDDITRKRKRQITDEVFHIAAIDKEDCLLPPFEVDTCQRARVFVRRNRYLCARTYITWPFNRNDPPPCVMAPPCRVALNISTSSRKPCLSSQESKQNGENIESMVRGDVRSEQVAAPSLSEEIEVKSPAAQRSQLTCVPRIFHQSSHDLPVSKSASAVEASAGVHTPWVTSVPDKPVLAEETAQGQEPSHGASWSIGGRLTVDSQSTTSSEDDVSIEGCPRDKSENDDMEDADEDTFDGSEVMCETLDALCSPSQTSTADVGADNNSVANEIQVHEQDAIVLDVIDDDPDLFGSMMTDIKDNPVQTRLLAEKGAPNSRKPANCTRTAAKLSDADYRYVNVCL